MVVDPCLPCLPGEQYLPMPGTHWLPGQLPQRDFPRGITAWLEFSAGRGRTNQKKPGDWQPLDPEFDLLVQLAWGPAQLLSQFATKALLRGLVSFTPSTEAGPEPGGQPGRGRPLLQPDAANVGGGNDRARVVGPGGGHRRSLGSIRNQSGRRPETKEWLPLNRRNRVGRSSGTQLRTVWWTLQESARARMSPGIATEPGEQRRPVRPESGHRLRQHFFENAC